MRARGGFKTEAYPVVLFLARAWPHFRAAERDNAYRHPAMKLFSLAATAACASAFLAPISSTRPAAVSSTALRSTRRDPVTGKIYVGEPEPLEELADLVGGLLGGLGRVADGLLGPAPVPIPIPVEDEREQAPEQPPVGTDPYKYPGTY